MRVWLLVMIKYDKYISWHLIIWAKALFFFEQLFPVVARTWLGLKSELFLGPEILVFCWKILFLPYDPNFGQWPVCSPWRDRYFSVCYETQQEVGAPYMTVQNVWTISTARNKRFEPTFLQYIIVMSVKMTQRQKIAPRKLKTCQKTFLHLLPTSLTSYSQCTVNFGGR